MNFKVCSNLDTMERAGAPYACPRPQKWTLIERVATSALCQKPVDANATLPAG